MLSIECQGSPREMGRQYGEAAREGIARNYEYKNIQSRAAKAARFITAARKLLTCKLPDILDELDGIAEGSGMPPEAVLYDNFSDTFGDSWTERCTPVALCRSPAGPLVGKNNDCPAGEVDRLDFVIRTTRPARGLPMIQLTYAGWISGLDAVNAQGLGNTHGSVGSTFDKTGPRVDIRLQAYHLMRQCSTTGSFTEGLMAASLTGKGFNIIVMDRHGDGRVIEAAVPLIAVRPTRGDFLYSTNHYATPALAAHDGRSPAKREISAHRYGYLQWREATTPPADLDGLRQLLASHEPWAPCRHGGAHGSHTVWSQICLCKEAAMLVSDGFPCINPYRRIVCPT